MPKGVYIRSEAAKAQCRINASKAGGFHGTHSDATREKMRQAKLGLPGPWAGKTRNPHSEETKQKMRDAKARSGFAPSVEARKKGALVLRGGPTFIELFVSSFLTQMGVPHFNQFEVGRYVCDIVVPRWNCAIECDGTFWHTGKFANKQREQKRDEFIRQQGIDVVRLPEKVIKDDGRFLIAMKEIARRGES